MDTDDSFGIRKVVDCKVEGGQQMYKVEWQATWEPAETLASCQHLIDDFWSHVNKAKAREQVALQHRKRMKMNSNELNMLKMPEDDKADIQNLISRTNMTGIGSLVSPSDALKYTGNSQFVNKLNTSNPCPMKEEKVSDTKSNPSSTSKSTGTALKYVENFDNPYVRLIVVCKICNKEQSMKWAHAWRQHYVTHNESRPHPCPHCTKSFQQPNLLKKHIAAKHSDTSSNSHQGQQFVKYEKFESNS